MEFDGDFTGDQIFLEGNDMACFSLNIGVGFVGAKVGFNQKIGIRGSRDQFAGKIFLFQEVLEVLIGGVYDDVLIN